MSARNGYPCKRCGMVFQKQQELGGHRSKGPLCKLIHKEKPNGSQPIDTVLEGLHEQTLEDSTDEDQEDQQEPRQRRVVPQTIFELLQRPTHTNHDHIVRQRHVEQPECGSDRVHRLVEMQDCYEKYCETLR